MCNSHYICCISVTLSASLCLILTTCLACIMYRWKKIHPVSFQIYTGKNVSSKKSYDGNESNVEKTLKGYDSLIQRGTHTQR